MSVLLSQGVEANAESALQPPHPFYEVALGSFHRQVVMVTHDHRRKQALAWLIRTKSIVGGSWITKELDMSHPSNVSRAVNVFRIANQQKIKNLKRQLLVCKD